MKVTLIKFLFHLFIYMCVCVFVGGELHVGSPTQTKKIQVKRDQKKNTWHAVYGC